MFIEQPNGEIRFVADVPEDKHGLATTWKNNACRCLVCEVAYYEDIARHNGNRRRKEKAEREGKEWARYLTTRQVREIIRLFDDGKGLKKAVLARRFGVSWPTINKIIKRHQEGDLF